MMDLPPPSTVLAIGFVVFFAIGLHEYAHCKLADAAGDPTPRYYGRVTLNLTKHFELMGTIMIIITALSGFGIGWGKPAPMDPSKMRNPKWDHFAAVAAGPMSNLLQAFAYGLGFRMIQFTGIEPPMFLVELLFFGTLINLSLMFFNLIPLGPLDGHWLVGTFLPDRQRIQWYQFNRTTGSLLLFGAIILSQLSGLRLFTTLVGTPARAMFTAITGIPLG